MKSSTLPDISNLDPICVLLAILEEIPQPVRFFRRDQLTLRERYQNEGLSFLTKTLPLLGKALENGLREGKFVCPSAFKRRSRKTGYPALLGFLFSNIFTESGEVKENACGESIYYIRQISYFYYKMELPFSEDKLSEYEEAFVETDLDLPDFIQEDELLSQARDLITLVVGPDWDLDLLDYRNGPGTVVGYKIHEKYFVPPDVTLPVVYKYTRLFLPSLLNTPDWFGFVQDNRELLRDHLRVPWSELLFVPKDSRGPRVICREPWEHTWCQQGIMVELVNRIESHELTRGYVNFERQSINQRLAWRASRKLDCVTMDMKDASDRNSLALFLHLFGNVDSSLLDLILSSRSTHVRLPSGAMWELSKFAPMGSSLCFPVMALTFWALLVSALARLVGLEKALKMVYVYGDDIIIVHRHAPCGVKHLFEIARQCLESYGFKVNTSKSFAGCRFSESCGHDYFDGHLVTPLRMKVPTRDLDYNGEHLPFEVTNVVRMVEMANQLYAEGFVRAANLLWDSSEYRLSAYLGRSYFIPYKTERDSYIGKVTGASDRCIKSSVEQAGTLFWVKSDKVHIGMSADYGTLMSQLYRNRNKIGSSYLPPDFKLFDKYGNPVDPVNTGSLCHAQSATMVVDIPKAINLRQTKVRQRRDCYDHVWKHVKVGRAAHRAVTTAFGKAYAYIFMGMRPDGRVEKVSKFAEFSRLADTYR